MVFLPGVQRFLSRLAGQRKWSKQTKNACAPSSLETNEAASPRGSRIQPSDGNHGACGNAGVCQSLHSSAHSLLSKRIMLTRWPDSARSARALNRVHIVLHICSMLRACLHESSAAIVSQPCLSDGESGALNNLTGCAITYPSELATNVDLEHQRTKVRLPPRHLPWPFSSQSLDDLSGKKRARDMCSIDRREITSEPIIGWSL